MLACASSKHLVTAGRLQAVHCASLRDRIWVALWSQYVALPSAPCSQAYHSRSDTAEQHQHGFPWPQLADYAQFQCGSDAPSRPLYKPQLRRSGGTADTMSLQHTAALSAAYPMQHHRSSTVATLLETSLQCAPSFGSCHQQYRHQTQRAGGLWRYDKWALDYPDEIASDSDEAAYDTRRPDSSSRRSQHDHDSSRPRLFQQQQQEQQGRRQQRWQQHEEQWPQRQQQWPQRQQQWPQQAGTAIRQQEQQHDDEEQSDSWNRLDLTRQDAEALERAWQLDAAERRRKAAIQRVVDAEQERQLEALQSAFIADESLQTDATNQATTEQQQQDPQQQDPQQQQQRGGYPSNFADLGLQPKVTKVLQQGMLISEPTPVQAEAWRPVIRGRHTAIQSPTGTGKTLAYLLPLMSKIRPWDLKATKQRHGRVLVIAPTQELCMQIVNTARDLIPDDRKSVMPLCGGTNYLKALKSIAKHKPWLIVATPGRLALVMAQHGAYRDALPRVFVPPLEDAKAMTLVLEEAPKLLAMDDTKEVLANLAPVDRHTEQLSGIETILQRYQLILVSASLKPSNLAKAPAWSEASPVMITAPPPRPGFILGATSTADLTSQNLDGLGRPQMLPDHLVHQVLTYEDKGTRLERTLEKCLHYYKHQKLKVLVFVGDRIKIENIKDRIFKLEVIHSRLSPHKKKELIWRFNAGKLPALVVTDAFALGLDFEDVDIVMQIGSLPASLNQYVHRAGRCGRMGRPGTVVSLIPHERLEQFYGMMKRLKIEATEMKLIVYPPKAIGRPVPPDLVSATEAQGDAS